MLGGRLPRSEKNGKIYTHRPKKEFTELAKEQKKTGGGEAPKMPSVATAKITDLFKETPSFTGLEGFESKGEN